MDAIAYIQKVSAAGFTPNSQAGTTIPARPSSPISGGLNGLDMTLSFHFPHQS
jgi:hypothetical protein